MIGHDCIDQCMCDAAMKPKLPIIQLVTSAYVFKIV